MGQGFAVADDVARLWFAVEGSGTPLVLCHGGPGLWDYLQPLARPLRGTARVIRWEQRGCGRSELRGPYSLERSVADLDQLRAHLGFDRWIVGGHSWGATLALQYALAEPARVEALVYLSGAGLGRAWNAVYHEQADLRLSDEQRRRRDELDLLDRTPGEEREYRTLCWAPDYADPSNAFELAAAAAAAPFPGNYECNEVLNAESKTWEEGDLIARCRGLDAPVLILHGAEDPRPVWAVDSLVAALPHCDLQIIPRAGHLPWVEAPSEVVSAVSNFENPILSCPRFPRGHNAVLARSTVRVSALVCMTVVFVNACGGSGHTKSNSGGSTAASSGTACTFLHENEVTSLFGTRPQQTSDPYGIGGTTSNCLWKASAGGEQYLLQIAVFDGVQHYEKSDKFRAQNLAGLGSKAFIKKGDLGGVTIEFVRASKTYFVLFSIAKTVAATRNDANAKADQLVVLIKRNLSRL